MKRLLVLLFAALLVGGTASHAQDGAPQATCRLFGAEAADEAKGFWELDPLTGVGSYIGDPGQAVTGLAFRPSTGVLYGATAVIDISGSTIDPGHLITIDPSTGAGTDIGSFGLLDLQDEGNTLADLTFDPATGVLYGWRARREGDLYTVNLATGTATKVGESGLSDLQGGGLTFGPGGKLFLAAEGTGGTLRIIDKSTGMSVSSISLSGYSGNASIAALTWDGGKFLYGVTRKNGDLIRIDPSTGIIETIGPAADDSAAIDGLTFDQACFNFRPAPAASLPGLLVLALASLLIGMRCLAARS
jgi:Repeat of unknown function (DUF6923)